MINTKKNRSDLYVTLSKMDVIRTLRQEMGRKWILRIEDGKFVPRFLSAGWDAPWVYVQTAPQARCDIYQQIFFEKFSHIHSYCRECWKVVVRPRTLVELFNLYEFQRTMGVPCKCGIELRDTVFGLYGGYFYNRGKEQGLERYAQVRELVNEHLSEETPVILKRYCTEYEIGPTALGPSDETPDATPEELAWEGYIEDLFPRVGYGSVQPDHMTATVMCEWIHHAYRNGDETYKEFTGGSPLFAPYVTYHDKEK